MRYGSVRSQQRCLQACRGLLGPHHIRAESCATRLSIDSEHHHLPLCDRGSACRLHARFSCTIRRLPISRGVRISRALSCTLETVNRGPLLFRAFLLRWQCTNLCSFCDCDLSFRIIYPPHCGCDCHTI